MQRLFLSLALFVLALVITWLIVLALSLIPPVRAACLRQQERRGHATDG